MLTLFFKALKALNSDYSPAQISLAVCLGMIIGLTPLGSAHNAIVLLFVLMVRVNLGIFSVSLVLFSGLAYLIDPLSESFGFWLLHLAAFEDLWASLYQVGVWRLLEYNNSLVIGSFIVSMLLTPLVFMGTKVLVVQYREKVMTWVQKSRFSVWIKSGNIFSAYQKLQG